VAPSLLANALLLQTHDKVSDEEAKGRADYDLRWKVALGIEVDERPFAKSTLQLFRAQLILKEKMRSVFVSSLELAKQSGYLKARQLKVILDTTNILGRGTAGQVYRHSLEMFTEMGASGYIQVLEERLRGMKIKLARSKLEV